MSYVRYESAAPNARGGYTGIFGLANGLARSGQLSAADRAWWRASNDWYDAAYRNPATADPMLFDRVRHPGATCWFVDSAEHLLCRVPGYLALLERYGVAWRERRSADPGVIRYADADQVVVTPYPLSSAPASHHLSPAAAVEGSSPAALPSPVSPLTTVAALHNCCHEGCGCDCSTPLGRFPHSMGGPKAS